jgi:putative addiction module component (TIGR02574 family)
MNVAETLRAVGELPLEEQADFVFRAWDQLLQSGWQPEVSPELQEKIERRLKEYDADPSTGMTWEEVEAHVQRRR